MISVTRPSPAVVLQATNPGGKAWVRDTVNSHPVLYMCVYFGTCTGMYVDMYVDICD